MSIIATMSIILRKISYVVLNIWFLHKSSLLHCQKLQCSPQVQCHLDVQDFFHQQVLDLSPAIATIGSRVVASGREH